MIEHAPAGFVAEPEAKGGVGFEPENRAGESLLVGGRGQQTVDAIADQFRNAGNPCGNARYLHRHGFHQNHRKPFAETGEHEGVGFPIDRAQLILIYIPDEEDATRESAGLDLPLQLGPAWAFSHETEQDLVAFPGQRVDGAHQDMVPLYGHKLADGNDLKGRGAGPKRPRRELGGVHPESVNSSLGHWERPETYMSWLSL